jgi:colanic acid biosynthesis glycosyl transferase WcaI
VTQTDQVVDRGQQTHSGRPKKVAIFTTFYWPGQTGSSQVMTEFAEFLAAKGVSVAVVTAMPFYPEWSIPEEYSGKIYATEIRGGVQVLRSWHFVRPSPSTLTRLLHEASLSLTSIPNAFRALRRADHCFVVVPALSFAFTSAVIARLCGVRTVVIVHDIQPDTAIELGMLRNRFVIAVSNVMARITYALASEIHTLGEGMRARIQAKAGKSKRVRIVPVTIDARELAPVAPDKNEYLRLFAKGRFTVVHSGNMGQKQDLVILLRAAEALRDDPDVHFFIFGDGAIKEQTVKQREEIGLTNVSIFDLQERAMLPHTLSGADVFLVSQRAEIVDVVVPSKMMTAMAAGAMVVASCDRASEAATLLNRTKGGIVLDAGDFAGLVRLIAGMRNGEVDTTGYRRRAREAAMCEFDRDSVYGAVISESMA